MSPTPKKPNVPPPPGKGSSAPKQRFMTSVPTLDTAPDNLSRPSETTLQDLNFKVSPDFHRAFKVAATTRGMTMKELLEACYSHYMQAFPMKQDDLFRK